MKTVLEEHNACHDIEFISVSWDGMLLIIALREYNDMIVVGDDA